MTSVLDAETAALAAELANRLAVRRIALRVEEAARALGLSDDAFREHVAPELRWIRRGRLKLVTVQELERWAERSSARTLEGER